MSNIRTWETQEVINFLINEEWCYEELCEIVQRAKDREEDVGEVLRQWVVVEHNAPAGLYESFDAYPKSDFEDVDWGEVAEWFSDDT